MENRQHTTNAELTELGTHANAATNIFKGRKTAPTLVEAPKVPNPGPYDTRTGYYE
ncbi:MAG TPA: hypothetical protein VJ824_17385 [Bacillota bacterium]|nr:hypothetical protein [Bacillota bacterium]